jgi:ParB-like chromosome segregation protein Spo0J
MTEWRVDDLHPHSAYVRHHLGVSASKLSALVEVGDIAFRDPLIITNAGTIIDGHTRWALARRQGRVMLPCIEYVLSEEEALHWLIQRHGRSDHLNAFCRILLALELEPWLTEQAGSHQQAGGQSKGSSKLTEADRLDVRSKIGGVAGASTGNVTEVKQLIAAGDPEILEALRNGEVAIHRAWLWRALQAEERRQLLMSFRGEKGVGKTIRGLVRKLALLTFLRQALKAGVLKSDLRPGAFRALLADQYRWWSVHVDYFQSETHFLRYAGRYARRLPIAQHRFEEVTPTKVRFWVKDKKLKQWAICELSPAEFVALLAEHVPDRYGHTPRYFGLLAPQSKARSSGAIFLILGQQKRTRPRRLGWRLSVRRDFGIDPLLDSSGQPLRWVGRLSPHKISGVAG